MSEPFRKTVKDSITVEYFAKARDQQIRFEELVEQNRHPIRFQSLIDPDSQWAVRWYEPRQGNRHGWG